MVVIILCLAEYFKSLFGTALVSGISVSWLFSDVIFTQPFAVFCLL